MKDSSSKKQNGIAAAFWIAVVLAIAIAFLVKSDHIIGVLKETAFFEHIFNFTPEFIARHEAPANEKIPEVEKIETLVLEKEPSQAKTPTGEVSSESDRIVKTSDAQNVQGTEDSVVVPAADSNPLSNKDAAQAVSAGGKSVPALPKPAKSASEAKSAATVKMNQYLCFIAISGDGFVERKEVNRAVSKTNTPLTAALAALLEGPGIPELEKGYISLIPEGTRLLSAAVQNKTAFVNFSQEFAFNKYGAPGYLGQLMQIVYTATAFNTIDNVQFLIEGQKNEYLGGEGVWIGTPLARYNFK